MRFSSGRASAVIDKDISLLLIRYKNEMCREKYKPSNFLAPLCESAYPNVQYE